jgi:hypothetical protein
MNQMDSHNDAGMIVPARRPDGYEPPALSFHGSIGQQTAANQVGMVTDAAFPAGTPIGDLTFSG